MKLTEKQALQLIEIANDAAIQLDSVAGYDDDVIVDLLDEIRGQMSTTPVELSDTPTSLSARPDSSNVIRES